MPQIRITAIVSFVAEQRIGDFVGSSALKDIALYKMFCIARRVGGLPSGDFTSYSTYLWSRYGESHSDRLCHHNEVTKSCSTCGGDGKVNKPINCSHGKNSSHSYCSHGKTSQHD